MSNKWMRRSLSLLAFVGLCFSVAGNAQQTLGAINGTVLDPSGAAVPAATVTITDADINVTRTTKSQGNGFFQVFNLPVGTYSVHASHDGFDTTDLVGISVQESHTSTVGISLKLGHETTSVEVVANPMLNATDTTNGYTLDAQQIGLTPLATGSFTQLAVLSPGVNAELLSGIGTNAGLGNQPIWANGQRDTSNTFQVNGVDVTNLFNGKTSSGDTSQRYNFNIGGGTTSTAGSSAGAATVGGANATGTSTYGSNGNSLPSPPPEFLQEMRVNTSMYDAQQGATAGAQIDAATMSGSNAIHGQMYGTFANNALNADPYFFKQQALLAQQGVGGFPSFLANPSLHRWTTGATATGPLMKDKLFYFLAYQHLYDSDQSTGLSQFQVPSGLTNDRSDIGIDAAATSWNNGTPYTGAINSISRQLLNAKLPDGTFLIPSAQTTAPYAYGIPNVTLVNTSRFLGDQAAASLDYNVTGIDRLSFKYYYQNDPVRSPYGYSQTGGFPQSQANGSQVGALDNTIALSPRLNWEQRLGYSRMFSYSYYTQTLGPDPLTGSGSYGIGLGLPQYAQGIMPGILIKEMATSASSAPGLKVGPYTNFANLGFYQNRLNPSTNVIWALGKHTILAGGGYSYTQLNIANNRNGDSIVNTKTFQNFVKGTAYQSSELSSVANGHNNGNRYYRSNEADAYVQDKWQLLSNLSITAGVRWDYHGGLTEKYGNMFNFDPTTFDVSGTTAGGFTVNNSGFVIAGNNPNATPGATDSTLAGRQWGISPRLGFAWAPKINNGAFVVRGGFGIYYDRGELFSYLSQPAGNGSGGPFGVTESAPLSNFIIGTGTTFANPLGAAAPNPPTGKATYVNSQLQSTLNGMVGPGTTDPATQKCSGLENQVNYQDCGDALNFGAYDRNNVLPYTINFSTNIQWQPRNDLAVTIGYTGNRGRHSVIPIPFNEPQLASPTNPGMVLGVHPHASGETQSYGFDVFDMNSPSGVLSMYGDPTYNTIPGEYWNTEDGGNSDLRTPYIGFSPNAALFETVGNSAYDALETHIEKRLSHHVQAGASYTWSHSLDEQSDIGLFFTGDDPNHLRDSYSSSDFDRTNVFSANFLVSLPDFAPKDSLLSYATNGWNMTGIGIVQSGEPYSLYEFYGAVGSIRFGDFPTLMNPVLPISGSPSAALTGNSGARRTTGGNYLPAIDPSKIAINYLAPGQKGVPLETTGPQDTYETDFVPGQRNIFRQADQKRLDLSFRKDFKIKEHIVMQYQFNVFNLTNTASLDVPQNQTQIRQNDACLNGALNGACGNVVNYGQVGTTLADQQSANSGRGTAGANLDQLPVATGSGPSTTIPLYLQPGQGSCTSSMTVGTAGCPNNGNNFGSVTTTIGGSRVITMGLRISY